MAEHTVKAFSEELDAITQEVARMGGLAETAINDALSAFGVSIDEIPVTPQRIHAALEKTTRRP